MQTPNALTMDLATYTAAVIAEIKNSPVAWLADDWSETDSLSTKLEWERIRYEASRSESETVASISSDAPLVSDEFLAEMKTWSYDHEFMISNTQGFAVPIPMSRPRKLGSNDSCSQQFVLVKAIPSEVKPQEVARKLRGTIDITWLGKGHGNGRHTFRFSELGEGRIIRA